MKDHTYLDPERVVVRVSLDQPVHTPAHHLVEILGLVGELISLPELEGAPARLRYGEGEREDKLYVIACIVIALAVGEDNVVSAQGNSIEQS